MQSVPTDRKQADERKKADGFRTWSPDRVIDYFRAWKVPSDVLNRIRIGAGQNLLVEFPNQAAVAAVVTDASDKFRMIQALKTVAIAAGIPFPAGPATTTIPKSTVNGSAAAAAASKSVPTKTKPTTATATATATATNDPKHNRKKAVIRSDDIIRRILASNPLSKSDRDAAIGPTILAEVDAPIPTSDDARIQRMKAVHRMSTNSRLQPLRNLAIKVAMAKVVGAYGRTLIAKSHKQTAYAEWNQFGKDHNLPDIYRTYSYYKLLKSYPQFEFVDVRQDKLKWSLWSNICSKMRTVLTASPADVRAKWKGTIVSDDGKRMSDEDDTDDSASDSETESESETDNKTTETERLTKRTKTDRTAKRRSSSPPTCKKRTFAEIGKAAIDGLLASKPISRECRDQEIDETVREAIHQPVPTNQAELEKAIVELYSLRNRSSWFRLSNYAISVKLARLLVAHEKIWSADQSVKNNNHTAWTTYITDSGFCGAANHLHPFGLLLADCPQLEFVDARLKDVGLIWQGYASHVRQACAESTGCWRLAWTDLTGGSDTGADSDTDDIKSQSIPSVGDAYFIDLKTNNNQSESILAGRMPFCFNRYAAVDLHPTKTNFGKVIVERPIRKLHGIVQIQKLIRPADLGGSQARRASMNWPDDGLSAYAFGRAYTLQDPLDVPSNDSKINPSEYVAAATYDYAAQVSPILAGIFPAAASAGDTSGTADSVDTKSSKKRSLSNLAADADAVVSLLLSTTPLTRQYRDANIDAAVLTDLKLPMPTDLAGLESRIGQLYKSRLTTHDFRLTNYAITVGLASLVVAHQKAWLAANPKTCATDWRNYWKQRPSVCQSVKNLRFLGQILPEVPQLEFVDIRLKNLSFRVWQGHTSKIVQAVRLLPANSNWRKPTDAMLTEPTTNKRKPSESMEDGDDDDEDDQPLLKRFRPALESDKNKRMAAVAAAANSNRSESTTQTTAVGLPVSAVAPYAESSTETGTADRDALAAAWRRRGLPVSAASLPVSAVGLPVSAASLPVSAASLPVSAVGLPVSSVGLPVSSASLPVSAVGLPVSAASLPVSVSATAKTNTATVGLSAADGKHTDFNVWTNDQVVYYFRHLPTIADVFKKSKTTGDKLAFLLDNDLIESFATKNRLNVAQLTDALRLLQPK